MRRKPMLLASIVALAALSLAGCGGDSDPLASNGDDDGGDSTITVGSANFPENVLLAEIYAQALDAAGMDVDTKLNIGSREVYLKAFEPGDASLDVMPEYTGNLRLYFNPDATGTTPDEVYDELVKALPDYLTVLDKASAEDKDAVVVTKETADKYHLTSIADLKPVAGDLVLGGPPEWKTRQTGVPGLKAKYGVEFGEFKPTDAAGQVTLNALLNGQIDAGNLYTTDPNVKKEGLVPLEDPKGLFAAQNVVPLVRTAALTDQLKTTLNAVSAKLDTDTLGELVTRVVIDKEDPEDVAADFLQQAGLD